MNSYYIQKIHGTPNWDSIPVLAIDNLRWVEKTDVRAQAQLCWDEEGLYVHMMAVEENIRAEGTGLLERVCNDSCLEFFFRPTQQPQYVNFEINPNGALFMALRTCREDAVRLVLEDYRERFQLCTARTQNGWELTYRIPFAFIGLLFPGFQPKAGMQMRGNLYKCGDLTLQPHYLAWNPIQADAGGFHRPQDFGVLILSE